MNLLQAVKEATESPDKENSYTQERYHEYMLRRSREEDAKNKTVQERDLEVAELKERIKKLEVDMAHVQLEGKQTLYG